MDINDVLFKEDQQRIARAVAYHSLGSSQLAQIAEMSAKIQSYGIPVVDILQKVINDRKISI